MALTERQQRFLNEYVREHSIKGKGKQKRANNFSTIRQTVMDTIKAAPADLPELTRLLLDLKGADKTADELKFDRASDLLSIMLEGLKQAIAKYKPPTDPTAAQPGDPATHQRLNGALDAIVGANHRNPRPEWTRVVTDPAIGADLKILLYRAEGLLGKAAPTTGELKNADNLINEIRVKCDFAERRTQEITKRKAQLDQALQGDGLVFDQGEALGLVQRANTLAAKNAAAWTRADETQATSMYLDMMLQLSGRENVEHKNFKAGAGKDEIGQDKEIVLAVRRKYKTDQGNPQPDEANFKMVVKPMTKEIGVEGFVSGGGASREMMGSVIGDKLQEMLGIELNVAKTKLVKVDGGQIGLTAGESVTASVQAFVKQGKSPMELAEEAYMQKHGKPCNPAMNSPLLDLAVAHLDANVSEEEIQSKAVFDLVSLHCDRHMGNFIVDAQNKLVPIDHGNILPTREGLKKRSANMGAPYAILAETAAAKKPLSPELLERIERLNIDELAQTMRDAKQDMDRETPGADVGNLEEGIQNTKRSAEFLKFAARRLTLEEIYKAYSGQTRHIFYTENDDKLPGFARAVDAIIAKRPKKT
jgi:ABC1 atypical kinase-like domain